MRPLFIKAIRQRRIHYYATVGSTRGYGGVPHPNDCERSELLIPVPETTIVSVVVRSGSERCEAKSNTVFSQFSHPLL